MMRDRLIQVTEQRLTFFTVNIIIYSEAIETRLPMTMSTVVKFLVLRF